jgi:hypothetical protein
MTNKKKLTARQRPPNKILSADTKADISKPTGGHPRFTELYATANNKSAAQKR